MDGPTATVEWPRSIQAIWARRLAAVAKRDGGDPELCEAWALAAAEAWQRQWDLQAIVPLSRDPMGHQWVVVLRRGDEHPAPNLFFAHGVRPVDALLAAIRELRAGISLPEPAES